MQVPLLLWAAGRAQHRVVQPLVLGAAAGSAGVTGVRSLGWEMKAKGFISPLLWLLPGCKWCWSPRAVCIAVGKQTRQVSSQRVRVTTIKQLNRQCATKG